MSLSRTGNDVWVWAGSSAGWQWQAELLKPFIAGETGHQYLTREGVDDALIEVSFGEHGFAPGGG